MYTAKTTVRVRYSETDAMQVVYHANYLQYFEMARTESIRELGFTYKEIEEQNIIMPVVEVNLKFLRSAYYDDLLTIHSSLKELPTNHQIIYYQEIYNEKKKLLCTAEITLMFLTKTDKKKSSMPKELYKKLLPFFKS
jgi:acyl-CoA thioester hydrolase